MEGKDHGIPSKIIFLTAGVLIGLDNPGCILDTGFWHNPRSGANRAGNHAGWADECLSGSFFIITIAVVTGRRMPGKLFGKDVPKPSSETQSGSTSWMLPTPAIHDAELIQSLVKEYYPEVYRLALGFQADPKTAFVIAVQALARTVHHRDKYWGEMPLDLWIAGIIQRIAKQKKRLVRKSGVLKTEENPAQVESHRVQTAVEEALYELRRKAKRSMFIRKALLSVVGLAAALFLLWMAGISQVISLPNPADKVRYYYTYQALPGDTLASISKLSGVSIQDIRSGNDITAGKELEPGMSLRLPL